jgi:hypothetical protein
MKQYISLSGFGKKELFQCRERIVPALKNDCFFNIKLLDINKKYNDGYRPAFSGRLNYNCREISLLHSNVFIKHSYQIISCNCFSRE